MEVNLPQEDRRAFAEQVQFYLDRPEALDEAKAYRQARRSQEETDGE